MTFVATQLNHSSQNLKREHSRSDSSFDIQASHHLIGPLSHLPIISKIVTVQVTKLLLQKLDLVLKLTLKRVVFDYI